MNAAAQEVILSVHNISKRFGGIRAVHQVSFDVHKGEILGLIGPNGSGKSTLFNCILGQSKPTEGHCQINGKSTDGVRPADLSLMGVGRTFQQLGKQILDIAHAGLARRRRLNAAGDDETGYLDPLRRIVESGKVPAQLLLDKYHGEWGGDLSRVYDEMSF